MLSIATMASNVEHYKLSRSLRISNFLFPSSSATTALTILLPNVHCNFNRKDNFLVNNQTPRSSPEHQTITRPSFRSTIPSLTPLNSTTPSHLSISTTTSNRNNGPNQKTEPKRSPEPTPKPGWPACRSSSTNPTTTKRSRLPSWGDDLL